MNYTELDNFYIAQSGIHATDDKCSMIRSV
jgi:hypothetical protein